LMQEASETVKIVLFIIFDVVNKLKMNSSAGKAS